MYFVIVYIFFYVFIILGNKLTNKAKNAYKKYNAESIGKLRMEKIIASQTDLELQDFPVHVVLKAFWEVCQS